MSKSFDFSQGLSGLNLSTAAVVAGDDDSVESMTHHGVTRNSTRSGGSGTTVTDLFASPRSQLSTGSSVGGGKGNTKDKVKLFYVENSQNYCCGIVGSGGSSNRACIKTAGGCTISKHQGAKNKFQLTDLTLYIKGPGSERILVTPSLHRDMVESDEAWSQLVTAENTIEVWRAELEGIAARHTRTTSGMLNIDTELHEEDDDWSAIGSPGTGQVQMASEEMATPTGAKLNDALKQIEGTKTKDDTLDDETLGSLDRYQTTLTDLRDLLYKDDNKMHPDEGPSLEVILSEWRFVVTNFKVIVEQLDRFKNNQEGHKEGLIDGLNQMNKKIKITDTKAHILSSKIGEDLLLSDAGSKTIWQVLHELSDEVKKVMAIGTAYNQSLTDTCTDLTIKNDSLVDGLIKFKEHHVATINKVFEEFRNTNTDVAKLKRESNRTSFGPATATTVESFDMRRINDRFDSLKGRIETLEEKVRNSLNSGAVSSLHARASSSTVESDLLTLGDRVDHEIANLKRKLHDMERSPRDEGKPFKIGNFTFTCPADLECLYDQDGFRDPDIGCFWELLGAVENMVSKGHDGKERADEQYAAMRVSTSVNSNDMMATMDQDLPSTLFAVKPGSITSREGELKACPTYAKWQGTTGRDSFQKWFSDKLSGFEKQVYGTIPNDGGPGARLAELLCGQLTQQWGNIARFVDSTYRTLVDGSGFSDKATWALIGRYLAAIFGDMSKYRIPVARLHPNSRENQIKILWAIVQCHRVVQEFIDMEFNSHPSIVAEIGVFILTERVDPSRISTMEKKLVDLAAQNKTLLDKMDGIKKDLEQVKESAKKDRQNWKNEHGQLSQVVGKIKVPK